MKNDRNKQIDEILGSLDGSQRASVPDFFYTRLQAKMLAQIPGEEPVAKRSWMLRPAYALTVLTGVLLINAAVILRGNTTTEEVTNDSETLQSIAAEYSLNVNNTAYDLTPDK